MSPAKFYTILHKGMSVSVDFGSFTHTQMNTAGMASIQRTLIWSSDTSAESYCCSLLRTLTLITRAIPKKWLAHCLVRSCLLTCLPSFCVILCNFVQNVDSFVSKSSIMLFCLRLLVNFLLSLTQDCSLSALFV